MARYYGNDNQPRSYGDSRGRTGSGSMQKPPKQWTPSFAGGGLSGIGMGAQRPLVIQGASKGVNGSKFWNGDNTLQGTSGTGGSGYGGGTGGSWGYEEFSYAPFYDLDLSAFDRLEGVLRGNAERSRGQLEQTFNTLLDKFNNQRNVAKEQFNSGRGTIAENAYDRNRQTLNDLASRGLAGSGLQQLGEVANRMETGEQMSNLAGEFYKYLNDIDESNAEATNNYNAQLVQLDNALNSQLANLAMQKQDAINQYNKEAMMYANSMGNYGGGGSGSYGPRGISGSVDAGTDPNQLLSIGQNIFGENYDAYKEYLMNNINSAMENGDYDVANALSQEIKSAGLKNAAKLKALEDEKKKNNFWSKLFSTSSDSPTSW